MAKLDWKSVLCNLLDCGFLDLQMLEDADEDYVLEAIDSLKDDDIEVSLNGIMDMMFGNAQIALTEAVNERIEKLEGDIETLSENEQNELMEIKELNPDRDVTWYCNCLDTSIYLDDKKEEVYRKYFRDLLDELEAKMGFEFE